MAGVDYAILSEWFDWITANSRLDVDLIGELSFYVANTIFTCYLFSWEQF